jgi:hypothetical protein
VQFPGAPDDRLALHHAVDGGQTPGRAPRRPAPAAAAADNSTRRPGGPAGTCAPQEAQGQLHGQVGGGQGPASGPNGREAVSVMRQLAAALAWLQWDIQHLSRGAGATLSRGPQERGQVMGILLSLYGCVQLDSELPDRMSRVAGGAWAKGLLRRSPLLPLPPAAAASRRCRRSAVESYSSLAWEWEMPAPLDPEAGSDESGRLQRQQLSRLTGPSSSRHTCRQLWQPGRSSSELASRLPGASRAIPTVLACPPLRWPPCRHGCACRGGGRGIRCL